MNKAKKTLGAQRELYHFIALFVLGLITSIVLAYFTWHVLQDSVPSYVIALIIAGISIFALPIIFIGTSFVLRSLKK